MKRADRSTRVDEREGRGNFDRAPRNPASGSHHHKIQSPSPYPRRPQGYNDKDYHDDRIAKEAGPRPRIIEANNPGEIALFRPPLDTDPRRQGRGEEVGALPLFHRRDRRNPDVNVISAVERREDRPRSLAIRDTNVRHRRLVNGRGRLTKSLAIGLQIELTLPAFIAVAIEAGRLLAHQHPPDNPPAEFAPPTGPQSHHNTTQSPPYPPTGPIQQAPGFSRAGFRGSFNPAGGGHRTGTTSNGVQWNSSNSADNPNDHARHSSKNSPLGDSPHHSASNDFDSSVAAEHVDNDNSFRPPNEFQAEDMSMENKAASEHMPPPARAPPTGPANSKFSFAFKATSKAPVATPKPEISQKFSAAPRKEPQPIDDRDRNLPRDTPRGPASSRSRAEARDDYHHNRRHPPERHERPERPERPRTRMVKKTHKKLKPKPQLPDDLRGSDSVYFRKPGNESVIGSGTYGKVFKGLNVYTKKLVALKKIRMEGERDGFPVTAVREIKLLQSLKHKNIVELLEVMVEKNDCYMVFEYLSHDLTGLLNHPTYKLDPAQRKHLAMQMFEGLDYLHKRGVLHRDIKAANILVSNDGVLKLADFGLARFYAKSRQYDYTNRVVTIWYRSPELLYGETRYGAACDIWSAACVLVEIFTRHAIFPGDGGEINQLEKIYAVLGTPSKTEWPGLVDMPWFELLRPGYRKPNLFSEKYKEKVPAAAFDLLAAMFQYDPAKRPSAAQVMEHPYFTTEQPPPRQATELQDIEGDWHEFESKALRREKEREARRAKEAANRDREKKRPSSTHDAQPDTKRPHLEGRSPNLSRPSGSNAVSSSEAVASKAVVN
ncbi:hypothetical protein DL770_006628 [Monosporascus sp. CRB-9-2]|nr:hypothetical protein DL770_006628 [Monosporascus sp. CRB-9-2]